MDDVNDDDHATAAAFRALSDPATLQLLIQTLAEGHGEIRIQPADGATLSRLAPLVHAGLMTSARERDMDVYRLTDPAGVQRVLDTARQLRSG